MKRRHALRLLSTTALAAVGCKTLAQSRQEPSDEIGVEYIIESLERDFSNDIEGSLHEIALSKGLFYGSSTKSPALKKDLDFSRQVVHECGVIVPEGCLKWKALRPSANAFDFSRADFTYEFANKNNLLMRGHTLVWHKNLPNWVHETVDANNAEQIYHQHITAVAKRFSGKIHSWDVVNEAVTFRNGSSNYLRDSIWLDKLGPSYIETAFHLTRESDSNALLVYNDNGMDHAGYRYDKKREAVLNLLSDLKAKGAPIDALGIQGHLCFRDLEFDFSKLSQFLSDVSSLGIKILITELDVTDSKLFPNPDNRDKTVAAIYEDYLSCVLDEAAVIGLTTWGLSDRYTWLSEKRPRKDGLPVRPLPLDSELRPKLARNAIARALKNAPSR